MTSCTNCMKDFVPSSTPQGKIERIGGVQCYVASPPGPTTPSQADAVVLFLADKFDVETRLLVDQYAKNGLKVVGPSDLAVDSADLDHVLTAIASSPTIRVGVAAYGSRARAAFGLAGRDVVRAVVLTHPEGLRVPEDFEHYTTHSSAPLLINSCPSNDAHFPESAARTADAIIGNYTRFPHSYMRELWDANQDEREFERDRRDGGAFRASVEWFLAHLDVKLKDGLGEREREEYGSLGV